MRQSEAANYSQETAILYEQRRVRQLELGIITANGFSLALIAAIRQFFLQFFLFSARFFLEPFNALANLLRAMVNVYQAHREGYTRFSTIKATVMLLTGIGAAIALMGGVLATAAFTVAGPIIAITSFSIRSLYYLGCSFYFALRYYKKGDHDDKVRAIICAIDAFAIALNVITIVLLAFALKASFGVLGIFSGLITALVAVYALSTLKPVTVISISDSPAVENSKQLEGLLSNSPSPNPSPVITIKQVDKNLPDAAESKIPLPKKRSRARSLSSLDDPTVVDVDSVAPEHARQFLQQRKAAQSCPALPEFKSTPHPTPTPTLKLTSLFNSQTIPASQKKQSNKAKKASLAAKQRRYSVPYEYP